MKIRRVAIAFGGLLLCFGWVIASTLLVNAFSTYGAPDSQASYFLVWVPGWIVIISLTLFLMRKVKTKPPPSN